jgi:trans-aconitate 2-methyltransferase
VWVRAQETSEDGCGGRPGASEERRLRRLAPAGEDGGMRDTWDPGTYETFAAERRQPFDDLLAMVAPVPGGRVVDLGCGTGGLTAELHAATRAATTIGVDASQAMLDSAAQHAGPGLTFERTAIEAFDVSGFDVIFANASLHWVADHPPLIARLVGGLAPGGQLAFQVPANFDHPSHLLAAEMAGEPRWLPRFPAGPPASRGTTVLSPERYAELLDDLGVEAQHVRLQVYGHHLASAAAVVDWVRGTLLTPYDAILEPSDYAAFVDEYRTRLVDLLGAREPYFYAFKRILVWARMPA